MRKGNTLYRAIWTTLFILLTSTACGGQGPGNGGPPSQGSGQSSDSATEEAASVTAFDPHWGTIGVFTDAASCRSCHRATDPGAEPAVLRYPDSGGRDLSPDGGWPASMMALAFHDPYFRAAVADETARFPALAGDIEDKCLTCHAPMGRTVAHRTGAGLSGDACVLNPDGCYRMETAWGEMHAREGVSCTLCHQQTDGGHLGTEASYSGHYQLVEDPGAKKAFGHYAGPRTHAMTNFSGHVPVEADYMGESAVCATCHNLYTPTLDLAGNPTGDRFLEQAPHLEWRNSRFAGETSCQDCHMRVPEPGYETQLATSPGGRRRPGLPVRSGVHSHGFVGGNSHMLEVMREFAPALGLEDAVTEAAFTRKAARTRAFLGERAAALEVRRLAWDGAQLALDLAVHNRTGHKLPTSFPSRRVWVHLVVTDGADRVVFESGGVDGQGRLEVAADPLAEECLAVEKPAGYANAGCYSRHRDTVTGADQAVVYEAVLADVNGDITHVLLHADRYLKDNRIPPEGFTESGDAFVAATATAGAARQDPDFNRDADGAGTGTDVVHYRVPVSGTTGGLTVRAELLYQSVRPTFVAGLHAEKGPVEAFKAMYEAVPPTVETLAAVERRL
ncbi:MAG TPA: hypothetical protein VKA55_09420 [Gammaproteobacteria bacterium]|nr:hypothetical protein [Gammaproteobacteria bacterium]